jgi:hypothetical protein
MNDWKTILKASMPAQNTQNPQNPAPEGNFGDFGDIADRPSTLPQVLEPAHPQARPVWWERKDLTLCGPARPELLAKAGEGDNATFWVVVTFEGVTEWICSDRLRKPPGV